MKKPIDYVPKSSLSIRYLKMIMSKREFNSMMKKYVAKKIEFWNKNYHG